MYVLAEVPQTFGQLDSRCKEIIERVAAAIPPLRSSVLIEGNTTEIGALVRGRKLLLLREGSISYSQGGKFLCFFETGDLIGLEERFHAAPSEFRSEFAVIVDEHDTDGFFRAVGAQSDLQSAWGEYLGIRMAMYLILAVSGMRNESETPPEIRSFQAGETIIEQNSLAEEVYTMVEGHADVFVDDVRVGEILADEIFGALAALTDTTRTAKVVATKTSMVLALRKENFIDLISIRPATSVKLVEDMARTIVALNAKVVSYKMGKT